LAALRVDTSDASLLVAENSRGPDVSQLLEFILTSIIASNGNFERCSIIPIRDYFGVLSTCR